MGGRPAPCRCNAGESKHTLPRSDLGNSVVPCSGSGFTMELTRTWLEKPEHPRTSLTPFDSAETTEPVEVGAGKGAPRQATAGGGQTPAARAGQHGQAQVGTPFSFSVFGAAGAEAGSGCRFRKEGSKLDLTAFPGAGPLASGLTLPPPTNPIFEAVGVPRHS